MPIKPDQVVSIHYTVTENGGSTVDSTSGGSPFAYLSGHNQILPKLEQAIGEMIIGGKSKVVLAPSDAYGEFDEKAIQQVNRSEFPPETEIKQGMQFVANTPEGNQLPFTITKVDGDTVTIDFNHALAGKTLTFEVELIDVRDATPEESSHGHVHGPDGHQD